MIAKVHAVVGALVCVALPAFSWLDRGQLAFTMFASTISYRLEIAGLDANGARSAIAPTSLARHVRPTELPYFAGAERWRRAPQIDALRVHLHDVAALACRLSGASSVDVALFERDDRERERVQRVALSCAVARDATSRGSR